MLKRLLENWLRARYGFPILMVGAVVVLLINEATYQNSRLRLTTGINLTDARVQAARALQLVTDAETGVRGYLLTGRPAFLAPYRDALAQLPTVQDKAFDLIAQVDTDASIGVQDIKRLLAARLGSLSLKLELYDAGKQAEAVAVVATEVGLRQMKELRTQFDVALDRAAALQQDARVSLYDAMLLNRVAVHLLVLLAVVGLYVYMRLLRQTDLHRLQEQQRLEDQVRMRTVELRDLAGHLVSAREDERGRLARELHDELGGLFTAMKLEFARVRRVADLPKVMQDRVQAIELRLNDGIALKRRIVENLRPSALDQMGLLTSLSVLCRDSARALGVPVHEALQPVEVAREVELTIYRLVQEALTNIANYAVASKVTVTVEPHEAGVHVLVEDDGRGFDPARVGSGHHGLLGMRYRVESHQGVMQVDSAPGRGTRIVVVLPLTAKID